MINKQVAHINFAQGLDTKNDPFQLEAGKFLSLQNMVFTKGKRLTKRNGYAALDPLPFETTYITTFNTDLTAISDAILVYSSSNTWTEKGTLTPLSLQTIPLIRNNFSQVQSDSAVSSNGYVCTVYLEYDGTGLTFYYAVSDATTGQNIVAPTALVNADPTYGNPKVFLLNNLFLITYTRTVSGNPHISFFTVSTLNPTIVTAVQDIATSYTPTGNGGYDGVVLYNSPSNATFFCAWNGGSSSGVTIASVTQVLAVSSSVVIDASADANSISLCTDIYPTGSSGPVIYVSYFSANLNKVKLTAVLSNLTLLSSFPVVVNSGVSVGLLTSVAEYGICYIYMQVNPYAAVTYISTQQVTQGGSVGSATTVIRQMGLGSKAFVYEGQNYLLASYQSLSPSSLGRYQNTYFLINGSTSTQASPVVVSRLSYQNGLGYLTGLPSVTVSGTYAYCSYILADMIQPVTNANSSGTQINPGIYYQYGINQVAFNFDIYSTVTAEIGSNLNLGLGYLAAYDGYSLTEQNFHLYPDYFTATWSATGGEMSALPLSGSTNNSDVYSYQVTYEWSDNQGNNFRSSPSQPVFVTTTGSGSVGSVTLVIPTLPATAKVNTPVKICIYRWSVGQQTYHQVTSIVLPLLNDTTVDSVIWKDSNADSAIVGNSILYTTGGILPDTGAPSTSAMTLFDNRLFLVDAEDQNLLWYSKQVIESTPVEMSSELTYYVAPSIGATGPTGPIKAISAMDDKLIIMKNSALFYINGTGPDDTGENNQYSEPTFITSMVGCSNPKSVVFQPDGLMFEFSSPSGSQIWLLGRDLSTKYIGAPVESTVGTATVLSSVAIPGTNQVRFNLSSGITLMYDYYYGQWASFTTNGVSSTVYQGLHTYLDPYGVVYQETPGQYLDGSNPVLMSFTTNWFNFAGVQGYQRAYFFYLMGQYFSPFILQCQIAYDYNSFPSQSVMIYPNNFAPTYGGPEASGVYTAYGTDTPYGGPGNIMNERIFLQQQRCQSFQIQMQEIYDSSYNVAAGQGLNLSGINLVYGVKSGFKPNSASNSAGTRSL